ncbi:hypothetical protein J132_08315 [Termitomyces sp. J132]|nr:hypothetical protein J132_08315 [Termitomyces sp. J132]
MLGFNLYQDKNMLILYDAVGTFANAVERALQDPCYTGELTFCDYCGYQQNTKLDKPNKSFPVIALNLLSGLIQGLRPQLEPVIQISQPNLLNLLTVCLKHPQAPVQQFAYSLVSYLRNEMLQLVVWAYHGRVDSSA